MTACCISLLLLPNLLGWIQAALRQQEMPEGEIGIEGNRLSHDGNRFCLLHLVKIEAPSLVEQPAYLAGFRAQRKSTFITGPSCGYTREENQTDCDACDSAGKMLVVHVQFPLNR